MQRYQEKVSSLSGTLTQKRNDRVQNKKDFEAKDATLSGQINSIKSEMELLENCIKANAFPCEKADKKALSYLINSVYAEEVNGEPTISVPPTTYTGITNYRNDFACDKRLKTTAIEYHFTAENYDSQDSNDKKLLAIWRAHTSPNGRVQ